MKKKSRGTLVIQDIMKSALASRDKAMKSATSRVKFNKPLLFRALSVAEITSVEVEFDGCGDSGQIESTEFYRGCEAVDDAMYSTTLVDGALIVNESSFDEKKKEWVSSSKTPTISELIEHICYDLLEANHAGWEINEGSNGTFTFEVGYPINTSKIKLEFVQKIEEVDQETY